MALASQGKNLREIKSLKKRAEFLKVAKGQKWRTKGFLIQGILRATDKPDPTIRVGITCSKKLGNAVTRNRAKRRLRHLAQKTFPQWGEPGWDYVLVGFKDSTITLDFAQMNKDLEWGLNKLHRRNPN